MKVVNKLKMILVSASLMSTSVFAASGRVANDQVEYLGDIGSNLGIAALAFLFFCGLVVLGLAGWFAFRDYVLDQREKKFNIGGLLFAVVIGAMLCYPGAAMFIGQDLFTGDDAGAAVSAADFTRE